MNRTQSIEALEASVDHNSNRGPVGSGAADIKSASGVPRSGGNAAGAAACPSNRSSEGHQVGERSAAFRGLPAATNVIAAADCPEQTRSARRVRECGLRTGKD